PSRSPGTICRSSSWSAGLEGLSLARQLAMTTYRSEIDFDERFGRSREDDGRLAIVSYLDHQGRKLVDRFDPATYRVLAGAMDPTTSGRAAAASMLRSPHWPTAGRA